MAAVADLLPRATALAAVVTYQTAPAAWLTNAARIAATGHAVIVNCKGVSADQTPCIVSLAELERLTAAAGEGTGNHAELADLVTERIAHRSPSEDNRFLCAGGHDAAQG